MPDALKVQGLRELKDGLRGSEGGLRDLRSVYMAIAEDAAEYVRSRVPVGHGSAKDGAAHKALPKLRSTVEWGATVNGPWVRMRREDLMLHEFGGTSYWYRGGGMRGLIRQLDVGRHDAGLSRDLGSIARRMGAGGHVVYTKPRNRLGNFIWNTPFRLRTPIGRAIYEGISSVCVDHGIYVSMPADPSLDLQPNPWSGRANS